MKALLAVAALLALAACQSPGSTQGTPDELQSLKFKLENYQTKSISLHKVLTDQIASMQSEVAKQQSMIEILEVDVKRLRAELDNIKAGGIGHRVPPPVPGVKREDAILQAKVALTGLEKGAKLDEVAADVIPIADVASTIFLDALNRYATNPELITKIETVLGRMPAKMLDMPLQDALRDRSRRGSAARVIGRTKDKDLSKNLEQFTADAEEDFCYTIGEAMLACKNRIGVVPLLSALKSEHKDTRFLAITALRGVNKNESFGYDFNLDPKENAAAIKQWQEWWDKFGPSLFE